MNKKRITSIDVAKLAGVSQSTVSRAFYNNTYISPQTRKKIVEAANTLGYRGHLVQSMPNKDSQLIGIIASVNPNSACAWSARLLSVLEQTISQNMHPLVMPVYQGDHMDTLITQCIKYQVKGIIITAEDPSLNLIKECESYKIPVVLLQRDQKIKCVYHICQKPSAIAQLALKMLAVPKSKKMGMLSCKNIHSFTISSRARVFKDYATSQGYEVVVYETQHETNKEFYNLAYRIKQDIGDVDGIFGVTDKWAIQTLEGLHALGINTPEDIQILGFDNKPESNLLGIQLSTIAEDLPEQSRTALHCIHSYYHSKNIGQKIHFQQILPIPRKTTRKKNL